MSAIMLAEPGTLGTSQSAEPLRSFSVLVRSRISGGAAMAYTTKFKAH
jgi:hypothetical protein